MPKNGIFMKKILKSNAIQALSISLFQNLGNFQN